MEKKIVYSEPADYIPEDLRKKYKLGEFAESETLKKIKAVNKSRRTMLRIIL